MAGRNTARITLAQLRRLHLAWRRWTAALRLDEPRDRALRHYFVELFSEGRARETTALTRADARRVIAGIERELNRRQPRVRRAAGTAGRRGFPAYRRIRPTRAAWRALWAVARALGMDRQRLDAFIGGHYAGAGLRGLADIASMADLNRVLWGLKAMLRRRERAARKAGEGPRAA